MATRIETAVRHALDDGARTADLLETDGEDASDVGAVRRALSTDDMAEAVVARL